jgi:PfaB family protein
MNKADLVAVVGIGGIFPGAADLDTFWKNILNRVNTSKIAPESRWTIPVGDVYSPGASKPDRVYSQKACFIDHIPVADIFDYDLNFQPDFIKDLDPLYHVTLYAGVKAFHDASFNSINRKKTGIIIGNIALPTEKASALSWEILGRVYDEKVLGSMSNWKFDGTSPVNRYVTGLPAGILAKALGLGGGSYTIDAACASSLYAVKLACDELLSGRADAMLTGGVCRPDSFYTQMGFSQLNALSPTGVCAPFDEEGKGLVVGEGAGMMVLKRLGDALRDGDHIYGVIRGIGLSNDRAGNLLAPDSEGQLRSLETAYEKAGWHPGDVDLIECHATGTPVGDAVEFASLQKLWEDGQWKKGQCVIGSVKSNIGHLLTGAGAAGMLKVLLALKEKTLPPTANFLKPNSRMDFENSPFRVLQQGEKWERRDGNTSRKAAVTAFGFGGINAHVLIEEWDESVLPGKKQFSVPPVSKNNIPVAVIGMDAQFGPWKNLDEFKKRVITGECDMKPVSKKNWFGVGESAWFREKFNGNNHFKGFGIDEVSAEFGEFRIPPKEIEEMLPQQLLMLKSAANALKDAGKDGEDHLNSGCFIGIGFDMNTTNFHVRWSVINRIRQWIKEEYPGLSYEEAEKKASEYIEAAGPALNANRTMGALGSIVASRIAREFKFGGASITISSEESSGIKSLEAAVGKLRNNEIDLAVVGAVDLAGDIRSLIASFEENPGKEKIFGEGAASVVLKRLDDAERDGDKIYGVIRGIGAASGNEDSLSEAVDRAYKDSGINPVDTAGNPFSIFEDTTGDIGDAGAANGIASLVKTLLCLKHKILPASSSNDNKITHPRHWLRNRADGLRRACFNSSSVDGNLVHVILEEYENTETGVFDIESAVTPKEALFAVEADTSQELIQELNNLKEYACNFKGEIHQLASEWFRKNSEKPAAKRAVSIVAGSVQELVDHLNISIESIRDNPEKPFFMEFNSTGRFYNPNPLYPGNKLAFVFSGSGNQYPGMGRKLALAWPDVLLKQDYENQYHRDQLKPGLFWNSETLDAIRNDHNSLMIGHVAMCTVISDILGNFNVRPDASIGYSLGESAALFSLRGCMDRDSMMQRFTDTNLFNGELGSSCSAARRWWKADDSEKIEWALGTVNISPEKVSEAMAGKDRVYILIKNAQDECVIGGDKKQLDKLLVDLDCDFFPLEGVTTVHCPPLKAVEKEYHDFHLFDIKAPEGIDFYSTGWGKKYELNRETFADAILAQGVDMVDFYRVINRAYDDGVRIFVEIGPGSSCTRIIGKILNGKAHCSRFTCIPGQDESSSMLRLLARLMVERVPVSLGYLYGRNNEKSEIIDVIKKPVKSIVIPVGGEPFSAPVSQKEREEKMLTQVQHEEIEIATSAVPPRNDRQVEEKTLKEVKKLKHVQHDEIEIATSAAPHRNDRQMGENASELQVLPVLSLDTVVKRFAQVQHEKLAAHQAYLSVSRKITDAMAQNIAFQTALIEKARTELTGIEPGQIRALSGGERCYNELIEIATSAAPPRNDSRGGIKIATSAAPPRNDSRGGMEIATAGQPGLVVGGWSLVVRKKTSVDLSTIEYVSDSVGSVANKNHTCVARNDSGGGMEIATSAGQRRAFALQQTEPPFMDRDKCMEFAIGSIGKALGEMFAEVDNNPTRVRLPDEPLMLVDRIMLVEGEPLSMTSGRVVTEHDVLHEGWYLDGGRIPTCIAVEAGQADLFLSGYLGIDFITKGKAVYRLLDAKVTFHRELPRPGDVIRYDIKIKNFFRQGDTHLFKFEFDSTVDGQPLLTMREGCAGFFSDEELKAGKGLIFTKLDLTPIPGKKPADWKYPVPMQVESYSDEQVGSLRKGDLAGCFGPIFENLDIKKPLTIPGGRMKLIDRIHHIDPSGGRFGLGIIRAEADIHPDDWFLTCHFCDDNVMPGTLMYECCMHTFRVFLLRMGWIAENDGAVWEPIPGVTSSLKCRGQVIESTKTASYEISIKELGYNPEPYAIADAIMYADGRPVVEMNNMSIRLSGSNKEKIDKLWNDKNFDKTIDIKKPAVYDNDKILAFAIGKPSEAYGEPYKIFDEERIIARLPGPPYKFLDRITSVNSEPWKMQAGGVIEAQYDIPPDEWYFRENRQNFMPFSVLLEVALQPCGWLAAYMGSALTSEEDMSFRNLGGNAVQYVPVTPDSGILTTVVKSTGVSNAGGMIIQNYDFEVFCKGRTVYKGDTNFGFFTKEALANQVGIRGANIYKPSPDEISRGKSLEYPEGSPFPGDMMRMINGIELFIPDGGPKKQGYIRGVMNVNPDAWFFKAHFYQDPVCPGSLGLESFLQLLRFAAIERWGISEGEVPVTVAPGLKHSWIYRGQIIPKNKKVIVDCWINSIDDKNKVMFADGFLSVDGIVIYQLSNFSLRMWKDK